jgi:hypothetical protein
MAITTTNSFNFIGTSGTVVARPAAVARPTNGNSAAPTETFAASSSHGNTNILNPQQALAMKAQFAAAKPAAAQPAYGKLVEQMASAKNKTELLAKFHKSNPKEYKALVQDIRDGKVSDSTLKLAVGLETLKDTKWAMTKEGAKTAAHLGKMLNEGKIATAKEPGGLGRSDIVSGGNGRDGKQAETKITIKENLLGSPEAVATVLAHEGQHSYRASNGKMERALKEEVDAHQTQNKVWGEFGKQKYSGAVAQGHMLDQVAQHNTTVKLYNYVAPAYVQDYMNKGGSENQAAARGVIVDYADFAGQDMGKGFEEVSMDSLSSLRDNAVKLQTSNSSENFKSAVESLKFWADARG